MTSLISASPTADKPKVVLMIAVWGPSYIQQFLDLSLRTLLSPGNLPALAASCDCTFLFLTHEKDRPTFLEHPVFQQLSNYCATDFLDISDITYPGNYSTTLTLAYERGMRRSGEEMTKTYFIYLVSDYIMADGSLRSLIPHMQNGVSGITAGNFQVIKEDTESWFRRQIDPRSGVIRLAPRDMVRYALWHLHPITVANFADNMLSHNMYCNRLFWRVDEDTMIGRFYLRHMLCIRPERDDYTIGASCDYSFIPEMCSSGNVVHLDDSDAYFVLELQPLMHELKYIAPGPFSPPVLAEHLSQWTTAEHRDNANIPVIFHASDLPAKLGEAIEKSARFVHDTAALLPATCQPSRSHPYWNFAVEAISRSRAFGTNAVFTFKSIRDLAPTSPRDWLTIPNLHYLYLNYFGQGTRVYPWSPLWHDIRVLHSFIKDLQCHTERQVLVVSEHANRFTDTLVRANVPNWKFLSLTSVLREALQSDVPFEQAFIFLYINEIQHLPRFLTQIADLMCEGAQIIIHMTANERNLPPHSLQNTLSQFSHLFFLPNFRIEKTNFVSSTPRMNCTYHIKQMFQRLGFNPSPRRVGLSLGYMLALFLMIFFDNMRCLLLPSRGGAATSGFITIRVHHHEQSGHQGEAVQRAA